MNYSSGLFRRLSLYSVFLLSLFSCTSINSQSALLAEANDVISTGATIIPAKDWWHPGANLTWQWQLTGKLDLDLQIDVIDIDLDIGQSVVDSYHNNGTKIICYISVGSYENWRADADQFTNDTGFSLTYQDQLNYSLWLAKEAHKRGLAIGQKNAPDQTKDLVEVFDFAITEDAFYYGWAEEMVPYIDAGKPVFAAEYTDLPGDFDDFCRQSQILGFSTILKRRGLGAWIEFCP